jgi:hypothetical protein
VYSVLLQGLTEEVAAAGASLSNYFEVYHRLLVARLTSLAKVGPHQQQQLDKVALELREACSQSLHTYLHAQQLLQALAEAEAAAALEQGAGLRQQQQLLGRDATGAAGGGGGVFRRMSQEVEAAAVRSHGGARVWGLQVSSTSDEGDGRAAMVGLTRELAMLAYLSLWA